MFVVWLGLIMFVLGLFVIFWLFCCVCCGFVVWFTLFVKVVLVVYVVGFTLVVFVVLIRLYLGRALFVDLDLIDGFVDAFVMWVIYCV